MMILAWCSAGLAIAVSGVFLINLCFFRRSPRTSGRLSRDGEAGAPEVSILIPARNEAARISCLLDSALRNQGVDFEICVLDDESTDGTDQIVERYARLHAGVRLLRGRSVPTGWNGKQFACFQLAEHARAEELLFLDADVVLSDDALARAVSMRRQTQVDLLSGFPRQTVVSPGEQLLIPLIHLVLLCFLPFPMMRFTGRTSAAAGCGQFFLTTKKAYQLSGGHSKIRTSMHDGITLPRSFRAQGLKTDLFDASDIATCRMYSSFEQTWLGLLKNAHEGFARMPLLLFMTAVMYLIFVHPVAIFAAEQLGMLRSAYFLPGLIGVCCGWLPRLICCLRFDRSWLGCLLNPVSIGAFLLIQWTAWLKKRRGREITWRSRSYEIAAS